MKYFANFLRNPTRFFKDGHHQKLLILSSFVFLLLCSLILLVRTATRRSEETVNITNMATSVSATPTITLTKWWIKMTATSSQTPSMPEVPSASAESPASKCPVQFSSPLKAKIYAYISLTPPLPNRIRSTAGLSSNYLGQIEPGDGLKVIDGPICTDGYSWWLVEAVDSGLRGWTVEGNMLEQWVVPCPKQNMACNRRAVPISSTVGPKNERDKDQNNCKSNKLAVGMIAQVEQDSLLVLRSEPYTGVVISRAGPKSILKILNGPICEGDSIWWKVSVFDLGHDGWATENDLYACPKDSECNLESFE